MKKSLSVCAVLIVVVLAYVAGARFNQQATSPVASAISERAILHYVDPMNPSHTTKEPGIAPCGMPMEPVYADDRMPESASSVRSTPLGTVRLKGQKQQLIGVQVGEARKTAESWTFRALGRVIPDENRVYALIAGTDGWLGEVHESTTGGRVSKDQLLAKIKVYNYDFFTWQQRYLTELGNAGRRRVFVSNTSGAEEQSQQVVQAQQKAGAILADDGGPIALPADGHSVEHAIDRSPDMAQLGMAPVPSLPTGPAPELPQVEVPPMPGGPMAAEASSPPQAPTTPSPHTATAGGSHQPHADAPHSAPMPSSGPENKVPASTTGARSMSTGKPAKSPGVSQQIIREDDILYASRARQELLDLGVGEKQLALLAQTGVYVTSVELRSPVDGLVLTRNLTPRQRISRGAECFRIADLRTVWVEADLYDMETQAVRPGMQARVSLPRESRQVVATVSEVLPRFDAPSRTLKVRLAVDNADYALRPDMFVDVEFTVTLPEMLTVPTGAVIDTGKNKTAYVMVGEGTFEPRPVTTGMRFSNRVEIHSGIQHGEQVVFSGNFLIDSESRMKLAATRLMDDKQIPESRPNQEIVPSASSKEQNVPAGTMHADLATVKDPVCGMNVNVEKAKEQGLTIELNGKTYAFCSLDCKEEFRRQGSHGVDAAAGSPPSDHAGLQQTDQRIPSADTGHAGKQQAVKDPICGMNVNPDTARDLDLTLEVDGQTYFFCSEECKEEFRRLGPQTKASSTPGHEGHNHD